MEDVLYAIVDPSRLGDQELTATTEAILRGGASYIQLRDKKSTSRRLYERAVAVAELCQRFDATFIVNDRLDIALACGADGVHVGPEDIPIDALRAVVDDDFLIGGSAGTPEAANTLQKQGADYLGIGAIYEARSSKPNASPPRGTKALQAIVGVVDVPVVGIGGIDASNAGAVMDCGASGVAVISALMDADDAEKAARELCQVIGC